MALDPQARRQEGVSAIDESYLSGSRGADGNGVELPTVSAGTPGPGPDRGIEANTAAGGPSNVGPFQFDAEPAGPVVRSAPVQVPDASNRYATDGKGPVWSTADSSVKNSYVVRVPDDAFDVFGPDHDMRGENGWA